MLRLAHVSLTPDIPQDPPLAPDEVLANRIEQWKSGGAITDYEYRYLPEFIKANPQLFNMTSSDDMLAAAALYRLYRSGRAVLPAFGKAAVVFTLVVLPGVLLFLRAAGGDASAASPDFIIWLKNWFGGHYFLSLWKMRQWRWVVLLLLSLFCLFRMTFSFTGVQVGCTT